MSAINAIKSTGFVRIEDPAKTRMPVTAAQLQAGHWTLQGGAGELEIVEISRGELTEWQLWRRVDKVDPSKPNPLDPAEAEAKQ